MKKKEQLYAVIGGCVGTVLTLVVCSFLPRGAESQRDFFGEIACTALKVVDSDGYVRVKLIVDEYGGKVEIWDKAEDSVGYMAADKHGGKFAVFGTERTSIAGMSISEHGGTIMVHSADSGNAMMKVTEHGAGYSVSGREGAGRADMMVNENGPFVRVTGKEDGLALMTADKRGGVVGVSGNSDERTGEVNLRVTEHGGTVAVFGKGNSKGQTVMGIDEYGNGAISTWDKNGYRQ